MNRLIERFCLIAAFGVPLAVYFYTAAPAVFWKDSAIFSTAAVTLGIPHSPGFPLWVILGKLFIWLIPQNPARATNLMCGVFGAGAVALFYLCVKKVLEKLAPALGRGYAGEEGTIYCAPTITFTALAAALVFAFGLTVWFQAVRAEVYSLQLLLSVGVVWVALSLDETEVPTRFFHLGVFGWGLSAAVHPLLSVAVLPGLLILGCFRSAGWKKEFSKWGWALALIFLAATVYLFLPLRSSQDPYMNWNQPDSWGRFISVITRKDDWALSITDTPNHLSYPHIMRLAAFLTSEYTAVFWILVLTGILALTHRRPRLGLGVFVLLLSNLFVTLWAAEFNRHNLDLLGYLSFGAGMAVLCAAVGLLASVFWLAGRLPRWTAAIRWAVPALASVLAFFLAAKNWAQANLRYSIWPQKVAESVLNSLPPRAVVVFSTDEILTPFWYLQGALGQRPDVAILLNDVFVRPVLAEQTKRRQPDLAIDLDKRYPFDLSGVQEGFAAFCKQNQRPLFSQSGKQITRWKNFWPAGYLLQYRKDTVSANVGPQVLDFVNRAFFGKPDFSSREILGAEIFNWASYLSKLGAPESNLLLSKAAQFDGDNPRMWMDVGRAYLFSRRFPLAENCFKLALSYDPYWGENYLFLAFVLQAQGKFAEAKEALAEGNLLVPDKLGRVGK